MQKTIDLVKRQWHEWTIFKSSQRLLQVPNKVSHLETKVLQPARASITLVSHLLRIGRVLTRLEPEFRLQRFFGGGSTSGSGFRLNRLAKGIYKFLTI